MKFFIKNITLLVVSLLLSISLVWLIGEVILRHKINYEMIDTTDIYIKSENAILNRELKPGYKGIYYGHKIEINSAGLRDYEYSINKPEGVYRIILLGDSMCFGQSLDLKDIYPKIMEDILNEPDFKDKMDTHRIDVINFSIPGLNTLQELEYLKIKAILYNPDLIIVNFFLNDVLPNEVFSLNEVSNKSPSILEKEFMSSLYFIKDKSYFVQYTLSHLAVLARRIGVHKGYISEFRGMYSNNNLMWQDCKNAILGMKKLAEIRRARFTVVIIPFLSDLNNQHPLAREMSIVSNFCKDNNIENLDLFPYFYRYKAELLWINPINGHPNKKAHEIMARAVSDYIMNRRKE